MLTEDEIQKSYAIMCQLILHVENNPSSFESSDEECAIIELQMVFQTLAYILELKEGDMVKNGILSVEAQFFAKGIEFRKV